MARKPRPHDEELPFVALMDTMTNVVGVLIIVLVLIGLGLAKSVKKVLSDLPLVSIEEHEALKAELAQFKDLRDPADIQTDIVKREADLQKITEALNTLETQKQKNPVVLVDLDALSKKLEAAQKERNERKSTIDLLLAEIDKLKIQLDSTPAYVPPASIGVRLPLSKPFPEKADPQHFLISEGRVMFLAHEDFKKLVEMELRKARRDYTVRQDVLKDPNGKPLMKKDSGGMNVVQKKLIFDGPKMTSFFNSANLGNRDTKVEVIQQPNSSNVQLRLLAKPDGGEALDQVKSVTSQFRSRLAALRSNKDAVLWFHVCRDSIPAYLAIRDIVDAVGFPVSWDIYDNPSFTFTFPQDYLVDFTPPPAPAPNPNAPPPVVIAAPKTAVD
ncbi:MAG: hypothetical protein WCO60_10020 [Verrucomicrobiota bacterium]